MKLDEADILAKLGTEPPACHFCQSQAGPMIPSVSTGLWAHKVCIRLSVGDPTATGMALEIQNTEARRQRAWESRQRNMEASC